MTTTNIPLSLLDLAPITEGHTLAEAITNSVRLAQAAARLKDSDAPIGAIAVDTGFQQVSYFGKCFRRKLGMSPRAYRQQHFSPEGI